MVNNGLHVWSSLLAAQVCRRVVPAVSVSWFTGLVRQHQGMSHRGRSENIWDVIEKGKTNKLNTW